MMIVSGFAMNGIEGTSIKKYLSTVVESEQYATNVLANKYKNGFDVFRKGLI